MIVVGKSKEKAIDSKQFSTYELMEYQAMDSAEIIAKNGDKMELLGRYDGLLRAKTVYSELLYKLSDDDVLYYELPIK